MRATELHDRSVAELARLIREREISPVELARSFLERIDRLDGTLDSMRLVCPERALAEARAAESAILAGEQRGPLHGIPWVAKDLFDVGGLPTSAGTSLRADAIAGEDSTVVARLAAAGMVLLGKANTVQFAYGGAGINHDHGTPHNPWQAVHHLPGGSSSGSAVAVAAGLAPVGLGTDTGGSVRIPASFCGITGLKTTVGQVSRAGVYPLSWTLDSVGPLARTAEDAALVYRSIQGSDPRDPTTHGRPTHDVTAGLHDGVRGMRIAFAESAFWDDADDEVVRAVRDCARVFAELGAPPGSIEFPEAGEALKLNPRAGVIAAEAYTLNRRYIDDHYDELDPFVAFRMIPGREAPAHEYLQATLDRKRLAARAAETLREVDALLCPTTMIPAPPVAEVDVDRETYAEVNVRCLRNTSIGNLLDLCGLSVPCGFTRAGLPIGLTIYGKPFQEELILRAGHAFQQATDWHRSRPDLSWTQKGDVPV